MMLIPPFTPAILIVKDRRSRHLASYRRAVNALPSRFGSELVELLLQRRAATGTAMMDAISLEMDDLGLEEFDPGLQDMTESFVYTVVPAYPNALFDVTAPGMRPVYSGSITDFDGALITESLLGRARRQAPAPRVTTHDGITMTWTPIRGFLQSDSPACG